jgi:hypothetical protein
MDIYFHLTQKSANITSIKGIFGTRTSSQEGQTPGKHAESLISLSFDNGIVFANLLTMKMKRYLPALVLVFLTSVSFQTFAQGDVIDQVKETIKAGSAKELSKYLNQTVDVTLEGTVQSYSKAQAEFVFRDFFKQHPPSEFSIIHQGSSKGGQPFAIGQFKSGSETYRVFMKIKAINSQQLVHEISFAKE